MTIRRKSLPLSEKPAMQRALLTLTALREKRSLSQTNVAALAYQNHGVLIQQPQLSSMEQGVRLRPDAWGAIAASVGLKGDDPEALFWPYERYVLHYGADGGA